VSRAPQTAAVVLLGLAGWGCAEVDEPSPADAALDPHPPGLDGGAPTALACSVPRTVRLNLVPADVLLLLDRSGSMDTAFGSGTRHEAVASLLTQVVADHGKRVRFGYQEFPGREGCAAQGGAACCASPPIVGVAPDNASAVLAAIAGSGPMEGSTPTAAALRAARLYFEGLDDGGENRYILLATDGAPACATSGAPLDGGTLAEQACAEARSEVAALVAVGIRVMVLGIGAELGGGTSSTAPCLDALAHAGGAALSPGSPGYYSATDAQGLERAIERAFGGLERPSCAVRFPAELENTEAVALYLDGQPIPRTTLNGWRLDQMESPPVARVTGQYCEAIQTFQVETIEVRYACSTDPPVP